MELCLRKSISKQTLTVIVVTTSEMALKTSLYALYKSPKPCHILYIYIFYIPSDDISIH